MSLTIQLYVKQSLSILTGIEQSFLNVPRRWLDIDSTPNSPNLTSTFASRTNHDVVSLVATSCCCHFRQDYVIASHRTCDSTEYCCC